MDPVAPQPAPAAPQPEGESNPIVGGMDQTKPTPPVMPVKAQLMQPVTKTAAVLTRGWTKVK